MFGELFVLISFYLGKEVKWKNVGLDFGNKHYDICGFRLWSVHGELLIIFWFYQEKEVKWKNKGLVF